MFNKLQCRYRDDNYRQRLVLFAILMGAVLGLMSSVALSVEALLLARQPAVVLSCDISAAVSCSSVARHWSAAVFGIPNSFIGMVAFAVVITVAVVLLTGARLPRWFMTGFRVGVGAGVLAAGWMLYMSVMHIGILCPWCLALDVGMLLIAYGTMRQASFSGAWTSQRYGQLMRKGYDTLLLTLLITGLLFLSIIYLQR